MAGAIKGVTIEFSGDTSKLDESIRNINKETRALDSELKKVNNALKFNPGNITLLGQKQEILKQKITETTNKLNALKQKQKEMDASGVDKNSKAYRELQREITETESKLKTFNAQMLAVKTQLNPVYRVGKAFQDAGAKIEAAGRKLQGISRAGKIAVAGMGALAYKTGTFADDINTMSKQYGISTKNLQKYKLSADLVDVSVEDIAKSQMKLKRNMLQAEMGSKSQSAAFKELGIDIHDSNGKMKDGEEIFDEVVGKLGKMDDATRRDAIAMTLMGRSAANLNPLILDGGRAYEETAKLLKKYDLNFLSQKDLDNANEFNDKIDRMKAVGTVALQAIGVKIIKVLTPAFEKLVGVVGKASKFFAHLSPTVYKVAGAIAAVVGASSTVLVAIGKITSVVGGVLMTIGKLVTKFKMLGGAAGIAAKGGIAIKGVIAAITGPVGIAVAAVGAFVAALVYLYKTDKGVKKSVDALFKTVRSAFGEIAKKVVPALKGALTAVLDAFKEIAKAIAPLVKLFLAKLAAQFKVLAAVLKVVLPFIIKVAGALIESFANAIKVVAILVKGFAKTIQATWKLIFDTTKKLWKEIPGAITKAIDSVKKYISSWMTYLTTAFSKGWAAIKTATTTAWNAVKTVILNQVNNIKTGAQVVLNAIKTAFTTAWNAIKTATSTAWNAIKTYIINPIKLAVQTAKTTVNNLKTALSNAWNSVKNTAKSAWNTIKSNITSPIKSAVDSAKKTVNGLKDSLSGAWSSIKSSVSKAFSGIKDSLTEPFTKAKDAIKKTLNKISSFFPLKLGKILNFKLPKIDVTGGKAPWGIGGKGKLPGFKLSWNAKGAIFKKPTIIGNQGFGEAGAEAALPLDPFWKRFDEKMLQYAGYVGNQVSDAIGTRMRMAAAESSGQDIKLDVYLFPNGPKMREEIVHAYDEGKKILG